MEFGISDVIQPLNRCFWLEAYGIGKKINFIVQPSLKFIFTLNYHF